MSEHDPLDFDCKCPKCQKIDTALAPAEVKTQEVEGQEKDFDQSEYQFFEYLENTESSWIQKEVARAKTQPYYDEKGVRKVGLVNAAGYLQKTVMWSCLYPKCNKLVTLRKSRHIRLSLCDEHKLAYDKWKDRRRYYGELTIEQRQSGVIFGVRPRTKRVQPLQEKKTRKRKATRKEVRMMNGKIAILKSDYFIDEAPHKQHV